MNNKVYLGDGVYVHCEGIHFILTTENGVEIKNKIYLEKEVMNALFEYVKKHEEIK